MKNLLFLLALAVTVCGCRSYEFMQSNIFADDDGNVVKIDYGRSDKIHTNTFISPANGQEMEFRSKLVIDVLLPDENSFTAWQCMNFLNSGTMYKTDNELWMVHVNGFTCSIYRQTEEVKTRYMEVYRGVLCESPKSTREKDERWRTMKKDAYGRWQ